jgi:hypothetical protein
VLIEIDTLAVIVGLVFTACCVYFNWKAGYRQGVLDAGNVFYDHAVKDTIDYLVATEGLPAHWKHQTNQQLIESVAQFAMKERGYLKENG